MPDLTISDLLMILAVLLSPMIALGVQTYMSRRKERRDRQVHIFRILMATRHIRLNPDHVQSLNLIDLEFYEKRKYFGIEFTSKTNQAVIRAWHEYFASLNKQREAAEQEAQYIDCEPKFIELLTRMAVSLDYDYDRSRIEDIVRNPRGYSEVENELHQLRKNQLLLLSGKIPLNVNITNMPREDADDIKAVPTKV